MQPGAVQQDPVYLGWDVYESAQVKHSVSTSMTDLERICSILHQACEFCLLVIYV